MVIKNNKHARQTNKIARNKQKGNRGQRINVEKSV